ncbi:MAG: pyrrolo-quinoline quinone [Candidatus Sulfotelmatobacter sp.]
MQSPRFAVVSLSLRSLTSILMIALLGSAVALAQDVLTYHNNNSRNGLDNKETTLTLTNVNSASFGKLFTVPADGLVDAEPLYLSAVTIGGVTHNLLIVASEHGTVYAYDADSGAPIWQITTLKTGETTSDSRGCSQITPEIGITSTPVILHPKTGNPIIYVVAMSKDSSKNYHQRLHALDATTGAELKGGPVDIAGQYAGTGDNSSGGFVVFDPAQYKERAGLLAISGTLYLAWASHCDFRPYTGWIMGYNMNTLKQTTILNVTPNGNEGAIWGAGAGMAADGSGNIFALDANGVFDTTLNSSGFPSQGDYGNAFLHLTTTGGLAVADYFEMDNESSENASDTDLGSGGTLLLSQKDTTGKTWNLAVGAGKDTNLYVVDRANMGKFSSSANNIYQELAGVLPGGVWSMPAALGGSIYYGPVGSPLLRFQFKNAMLLKTAAAKSTNSFGYPGTTPSISANGIANAIVWAAENTAPAVLHAYNAQTLIELYNTNQATGSRDHFGNGNKYITPMIANGKVYVGATNGVGVFGLLSPR